MLCSCLDDSTYSFGTGSAPINIANVYCRGFESSLAECGFSTGLSTHGLSNCARYGGSIVGAQCRSSEQNKHMLATTVIAISV